jgi:predicted nucleic acid-binding protein
MSGGATGNIVVVNTNVISFLFKGDTRAMLYEPHLDGKLQMIAAQTLAELGRWALFHNWGERRREALREYLREFVFVSADETVCLHWAEVKNNAHRIGRPISSEDAWIAATALAYNVPLVTHNPDDFKNVPNLTVITEK